jgi:hypothetical protein
MLSTYNSRFTEYYDKISSTQREFKKPNFIFRMRTGNSLSTNRYSLKHIPKIVNDLPLLAQTTKNSPRNPKIPELKEHNLSKKEKRFSSHFKRLDGLTESRHSSFSREKSERPTRVDRILKNKHILYQKHNINDHDNAENENKESSIDFPNNFNVALHIPPIQNH